uniref:Late embryogenesis abundant protein n=1 Tax=Kalanchoe fedtschenkoi TaxID=63787 RepID=A0A7N0TMY9_KALFE
MARSFSTLKLISAFVADDLSVALNRRGFAKAAGKGAYPSKAAGGGGGGGKSKAREEASSMWVPDPVTGHYRPQNQAVQVDAAELRKRLLGKTFTTSN